MGKHIDEDDQKTLTEFWEYLLELEMLGPAEDEPQSPYHTPEVRKRVIAAFLAERAKKREATYRG